MGLRDVMLHPPGEGLSHTGRLVLRSAGWFVMGVALLAIAVLVGGLDGVRPLVAGALIAWGGGVMSWSVFSARQNRLDIRQQLRHHAEYTVLHRRLNDIAAAVDASEIEVAGPLENEIAHMEAMIAHWAGLEEYRGE